MTPVDDGLDPRVIHPLNRLRICAMLNAAQEVEFASVQAHLGVTASVLSKQLAYLADAGYVSQRRVLSRSRHRVWLRLTRAGRTAYSQHLTVLKDIVGDP